jgi:hypothetical protein
MRERTIAVPRRCRKPRCQRNAESRGLCGSCYAVARRLVEDNAITWDELLRRGKIDEPRRDAKEWFLAS